MSSYLRTSLKLGLIPTVMGLCKTFLGNNFVSVGHVCNTFCSVLLKLVHVWFKHYWLVLTCIWAVFLPFFTYIFYFFQIFSFLGSVSDGHFSEHQKWHLWLWWNYCQTIQTSRKTTIDDLFLYQLLISRYLHLSRLFNCSIVLPLSQKITFVDH